MCQCRQNPATEVSRYGAVKFCITRKPRTLAEPIAMAEYPAKSQ